MPEIEAIVDGEGGKRVTITIAERDPAELQPPGPGDDDNTFVIYNTKYKLTITIAE